MIKRYRHTPDNFEEIRPYVITEPAEAGREMIQAEKCYFYDACSFRNHMELPHSEYLLAYIRRTKGIVIITRCILMELCSQDSRLWKDHIDYIRRMSESGIKVLVIFEEDLFVTLSMCFSEFAEVNSYLIRAVHVVKSRVGTVESTLKTDEDLKKEILLGKQPSDKKKFSRFFSKTRENKESGDSLGEELLAICIHMLAGIPERNEYKYVLFTEDKGAVSQIGKVIKNLREHGRQKCAAVITSPKLAQLLWEEQMITKKEEVEEILSAGNAGGAVKVLCSEKYDLIPDLKTIECGKLAEKIIEQGTIHINY